jgi:hypothetical protein
VLIHILQLNLMLHQRKSRLLWKTKAVARYSLKLYVGCLAIPNRWRLIICAQLMNSNRYGESRAAYREVQERHEDIKRIEKTIGELAQLFNDVCFVRVSVGLRS